jgi:hypothetical protein
VNNQDLERDGYNLQKGYLNRRDGEMYFLKLVTGDPYGEGKEQSIYQLKNVCHYWQGTESEFKKCF